MANGAGLSTIDDQSKASTSSAAVGWAVMSGINTVLGTLSPMLVNQPDLARYCKTPRDAGLLQGVSVFVAKFLVMFLGLAATSSIQGAWGKTYWNFWVCVFIKLVFVKFQLVTRLLTIFLLCL
jgi:nucleobase:cation symporter-1, NCS1 family